jgi:hypothetical protein
MSVLVLMSPKGITQAILKFNFLKSTYGYWTFVFAPAPTSLLMPKYILQYILFSPQFIFHKARDGPNPVEFPPPEAIDKRPIKGRKEGRKSGPKDGRRRRGGGEELA